METSPSTTPPIGRLLAMAGPAYWSVVGTALILAVWGVIDLLAHDAGAGNPGPARVAYAEDAVEGIADEALARIEFPWKEILPTWSVAFSDGRESTVGGYTWSAEHRIEIFVDPDDDPGRVARVLAHELGHAIDVERNTPEERQRWIDQRHLHAVDWWPESGGRDFATGAGDFAEVFAAWLVGDGDFRSEVGPPPDADDLALMRELALDS